MARILAIDYGAKRVGVAVTDSLKIIASSLETVPTATIMNFLLNYCKNEEVEAFVIGLPINLDGNKTDGTIYVEKFIEKLKIQFPEMPIHTHDERFTSKMAVATMVAGGMKKKDRQIKGNIDKISATIILQSFLEKRF